jgi:serine/threonine protein kinase
VYRVGKFEVVEELGRGAMGVVFRGFDPAIGRPVAIKVIRPQIFATNEENQEARLRFAREAAAAGRLSHPNIVTVFELGDEQDYQFLVMEFVEGKALDRVPPQNPLTVLQQLAAALDYAHVNGVVHRDVKPSNVLVRADGQVKLTDFGIARIASQTVTQSGMTLGTPAYMAPEQVIASRVDGRADQFSLAVVAYELLTGRKPFVGDTSQAVIYAIVQGDRPAAHEFNPRLPAAVSGVLQKALAKGALDRFPTCSEFIRALESAFKAPAEQRPISSAIAPRPSTVSHHKPALKRPVNLAAIFSSVVLLAAMLSGGYALWRETGLKSNTKQAVASVSPASSNTKSADSSPQLPGVATRTDPSREPSGSAVGGRTSTNTKAIDRDGSRQSPRPPSVATESAPSEHQSRSSFADASLLKPGIIYLRIRTFASSNMAREVTERMAGLNEAGAAGLILDLREESGGNPTAATSLAGRFLHKGECVVELRGSGQLDGKYEGVSSVAAQNYPIVVLLGNQLSLGSSVVADALQDHDRAWLLGPRSITLQGISTGTTRLYAPSGRLIGAAPSTDDKAQPTSALKFTDSGRKVYDNGSIVPDEIPFGFKGEIGMEVQPGDDPEVLKAIERLPAAARLMESRRSAGRAVPASPSSPMRIGAIDISRFAGVTPQDMSDDAYNARQKAKHVAFKLLQTSPNFAGHAATYAIEVEEKLVKSVINDVGPDPLLALIGRSITRATEDLGKPHHRDPASGGAEKLTWFQDVDLRGARLDLTFSNGICTIVRIQW